MYVYYKHIYIIKYVEIERNFVLIKYKIISFIIFYYAVPKIIYYYLLILYERMQIVIYLFFILIARHYFQCYKMLLL